jgi:hypothetical protein
LSGLTRRQIQRRIARELIGPVVIALTASAAIVGAFIWGIDAIERLERGELHSRLEFSLKQAELRLDDFYNRQDLAATQWADSPDIVSVAEQLLAAHVRGDDSFVQPVHDQTRSRVGPFLSRRGYLG